MGSSFCYRMLQTIIGFSMQICDAQLPTDGICYVLLKIVGVISMLMLRLYRNGQGCCSNKMSPMLSTDHCILDGQVVGFSHLSPITSFVYSIVIYTLTFMPH